MSDFNKLFSSNLNYLLKRDNMTQAEFAKKLGVGTTSVYNWCSGLKTPRMDKIDKMCEIFNITRSYLIAFDYVSVEEEQNLMSAYKNASEDTKKAVCAVLGVQR